jgi:cellulose synthase/poly-beta-1,6-N-acetylglucosamine synthase-like glycosyltransferase/peptidoglycan/xylan/chitin deacetylase (PgdA/CDA1 family)
MTRKDPRGHWILLLLAGLTLAAALLLDGFAHGAVGETPQHQHAVGGNVPDGVAHGGPVLNLSGAAPRSARATAKTIALTFDDGPDPTWTPQILDVLKRHHAHATFFVIGAHAAANPGLIKRTLAEGNEIGNHTYTHIDMASAPAWRIKLELDLTQQALAGAAGVHTRLMRMPYSSAPDGLTGAEWQAAQRAGRLGYAVILTDRDTEDWARPGVNGIVKAATNGGRQGAVVMLHDSGGDRLQTVQALDIILTRLARQGYRFTTISQAVGLPPADVPVASMDRLTGEALVFGQRSANWLISLLTVLFTLAGVITLLRLAVLVGFAQVHVRRIRRAHRRRAHPWRAAGSQPPPVSVVVPAYNEEASIAATVRSILDTDYPAPIEVIVVDDGSSDRTSQIVAGLNLPQVYLVRKENGGKPSALNAGIARARAQILVLVDGDTVFQRDTIGNLVGPLADPAIGAVSGNTKVANRRGILGRWQHIEYVIGFNLDRRMFDVLQCMPTIPGAIGAFRRAALAGVGGVSNDTLAEDTDLTMAVCRHGWRVVYEETALAWTEAPSSIRQLWRQRYRWCYGTLQAMWKHKGAIIEKAPFGRRCLSYLLAFQVLLPLLAPAVDIFALYGLVFLDPGRIALIWTIFVAVQALAGAYALRLDGERLSPLWTLPLQQVVYRQLMYLVVIQSLVTALLGARLRWHTIQRTGTFTTAGPQPVKH